MSRLLVRVLNPIEWTVIKTKKQSTITDQFNQSEFLSKLFFIYCLYAFIDEGQNKNFYKVVHKMAANSDQKQARVKTYATSIGSSIAGFIAKVVCHPIDTLKAKVQVNRMKMTKVSDMKLGGATDIAMNIFRTEGIKGFFPGVTISVIGSTFAFSLYMTTYEKSKAYLSSEYKVFKAYPFFGHMISGFVAEIASCALWLPIDVIKERLQVQSELSVYSYKGPKEAIKKIHLTQGIVGLYRAFGATILYFGPNSAINFALYEEMKKIIVKDQKKPSFIQTIICSSVSSAITGFVTNPLEIVKLRMQVQRADIATRGGSLQQSVFGYRNSIHGLLNMLKNEGFFSLYKGAFLKILFTIPMITISFSFTEFFKQKILESKILETFI